MNDTISRYLTNVADVLARRAIQFIINPVADRMSSCMLNTAGLAIKAGGSAIVKTGATAFYAYVKGVLVTVAAATDMAALVGTVANATFNVYYFYVDAAGVLTSQMGTAGATLALVKAPAPPVNKTIIGFIVVNPTGTGDFVGGTTALDDATVVPTVVYINSVAGFDPTVQLGAAV